MSAGAVILLTVAVLWGVIGLAVGSLVLAERYRIPEPVVLLVSISVIFVIIGVILL